MAINSTMKKIIILPIGFILTNVLYTACCNCKPVKNHFFSVQNLTISAAGSGNKVVDNGNTVYMDSLYLETTFNVTCVAAHQNPFSFLVNSAYACSCENCGDQGLKSALTSVEITSNNTYNGIAAGNSLNQFFKTYNKYHSSYSPGLSIDSMTTLINSNKIAITSFNLYTQTKPGNTSGHQLQVKTSFANGSVFTTKTKAIFWQ
jgi:hypothetical protein